MVGVNWALKDLLMGGMERGGRKEFEPSSSRPYETVRRLAMACSVRDKQVSMPAWCRQSGRRLNVENAYIQSSSDGPAPA